MYSKTRWNQKKKSSLNFREHFFYDSDDIIHQCRSMTPGKKIQYSTTLWINVSCLMVLSSFRSSMLSSCNCRHYSHANLVLVMKVKLCDWKYKEKCRQISKTINRIRCCESFELKINLLCRNRVIMKCDNKF